MKKLLVVTYGGGHSNIIKALYPELSKKFNVVLLALTVAEECFKAAGIPYKSLEDYMSVIDKEDDVIKLGKEFIERYEIDYSRLGIEKSALYYGCNIRDYIREYGREDLMKSYSQYGRLLFLPVYTMKKIIESENPDAVLATNSPRFERAAVLASKELNIKNFSIEDLFGDTRLFSIKDKEINYFGDYLFVLDAFVKQFLINRGIKAQDIIVTGQPAFEGIEKVRYDSLAFREMNDLPFDKDIICWASEPSTAERIILDELVEAFSKIKNKVLIIKPHPNEKCDFMVEKLKNYKGDNIKLITNLNVREIISVSEVLLTQQSTCGLEAIFMKTPVVVLNPLNQEYPLDYSKLGLGISVNKIAVIGSVIDRIKEKSDVNIVTAINNIMSFSVPESPSRNIVQAIEGVLRED